MTYRMLSLLFVLLLLPVSVLGEVKERRINRTVDIEQRSVQWLEAKLLSLDEAQYLRVRRELERRYDAIPAYVEQLQSGNSTERLQALKKLAELRAEAAYPELVSLVNDTSAGAVRGKALMLLGNYRKPEVEALAVRSIAAPEEDPLSFAGATNFALKKGARCALLQLGTPAALKALSAHGHQEGETLTHKDPNIRAKALRNLRNTFRCYGGPIRADHPLLISALKDSEEIARASGLQMALQFGFAPEHYKTIRAAANSLLKHSEQQVKDAAIKALTILSKRGWLDSQADLPSTVAEGRAEMQREQLTPGYSSFSCFDRRTTSKKRRAEWLFQNIAASQPDQVCVWYVKGVRTTAYDGIMPDYATGVLHLSDGRTIKSSKLNNSWALSLPSKAGYFSFIKNRNPNRYYDFKVVFPISAEVHVDRVEVDVPIFVPEFFQAGQVQIAELFKEPGTSAKHQLLRQRGIELVVHGRDSDVFTSVLEEKKREQAQAERRKPRTTKSNFLLQLKGNLKELLFVRIFQGDQFGQLYMGHNGSLINRFLTVDTPDNTEVELMVKEGAALQVVPLSLPVSTSLPIPNAKVAYAAHDCSVFASNDPDRGFCNNL